MTINLPDNLADFVRGEIDSGRYSSPDQFVADLVQSERQMRERVESGLPIPIDEHFDRRLEALLDEAEDTAYLKVTSSDFDGLEREALEILRSRKA